MCLFLFSQFACNYYFSRLSRNTTVRANENNTSERAALSENCTTCACSTEVVAAAVDLLFLQLSTSNSLENELFVEALRPHVVDAGNEEEEEEEKKGKRF